MENNFIVPIMNMLEVVNFMRPALQAFCTKFGYLMPSDEEVPRGFYVECFPNKENTTGMYQTEANIVWIKSTADTDDTMAHELGHWVQRRNLGQDRWNVRYAEETVTHGYTYNQYEIEAREMSRIFRCFKRENWLHYSELSRPGKYSELAKSEPKSMSAGMRKAWEELYDNYDWHYCERHESDHYMNSIRKVVFLSYVKEVLKRNKEAIVNRFNITNMQQYAA